MASRMMAPLGVVWVWFRSGTSAGILRRVNNGAEMSSPDIHTLKYASKSEDAILFAAISGGGRASPPRQPGMPISLHVSTTRLNRTCKAGA
jgi:hypothetical protein